MPFDWNAALQELVPYATRIATGIYAGKAAKERAGKEDELTAATQKYKHLANMLALMDKRKADIEGREWNKEQFEKDYGIRTGYLEIAKAQEARAAEKWELLKQGGLGGGGGGGRTPPGTRWQGATKADESLIDALSLLVPTETMYDILSGPGSIDDQYQQIEAAIDAATMTDLPPEWQGAISPAEFSRLKGTKKGALITWRKMRTFGGGELPPVTPTVPETGQILPPGQIGLPPIGIVPPRIGIGLSTPQTGEGTIESPGMIQQVYRAAIKQRINTELQANPRLDATGKLQVAYRYLDEQGITDFTERAIIIAPLGF